MSYLTDLLALWKPIHAQCADKSSATKTSFDKRTAYRKDFEKRLQTVYKNIPPKALTTSDRNTLRLPERDPVRTAAGLPKMAPLVNIDEMTYLHHRLRFQNPETPNLRAKPKGVASVELYLYITDNPDRTKDPPMEKFSHHASTGKFLFDIIFEPEDRGKTVWYVARYKNTRGQFGPISLFVPGIVA